MPSSSPNLGDLLDRFEKAQQRGISSNDRYEEYRQRYENEYQVPLLSLRVNEKIRPFAATVNWSRLCIESLANRMSIAGFITSIDKNRKTDSEGNPVGGSVDELLWDWWQAGNMDKESRLAHVEALLQGAAYVIVNFPPDSDYPEFVLATSQNMYVSYNPRTREVEEAFQWFASDDLDLDETIDAGTIYTRDEIIQVVHGDDGWVVVDREVHGLGIVPVAPLVNRAKVGDRFGRSEITDLIPLSDFASRLMTNAQVALEFLAMPFRYATGVDKDDFVDQNGAPMSSWRQYASAIAGYKSAEAKVGQLPGADMRNFVEIFNMLAKQVSSVSGLPPHALGLTTSNPASAEAIRSGESNLVMRILDRSAAFEQGWELAMRIALIWADNEWSEAARTMRIETTWANPETPTFSAKADAVVKLRQAKVIPNVQAQEDLGYSPEKIRKNERLLQQEREQDYGFNWGAIDGGGVTGDGIGGLPEAVDTAGQGVTPAD